MAPISVRSALAAHRLRLEQNISEKGWQVVVSQAVVFVICIGVAAVAEAAQDDIDSVTCTTSPIALKSWFLGVFVAHLVAAGVFLLIGSIVASVITEQNRPELRAARGPAQRSSLAQAPGQPSPQASEDPASPPVPEPPSPVRPSLFVQLLLAAGQGRALCLALLIVVVFADFMFLLAWNILGLVTAVHAEADDDLKHACRNGLTYFWVLAVCAMVNALFKLFAACYPHGRGPPSPQVAPGTDPSTAVA